MVEDFEDPELEERGMTNHEKMELAMCLNNQILREAQSFNFNFRLVMANDEKFMIHLSKFLDKCRRKRWGPE